MKSKIKVKLIKELSNLYNQIDDNENIDFMTPPSKYCWPQTIKELRKEIQLCKDILSGKNTTYNKVVREEEPFDYHKLLGLK